MGGTMLNILFSIIDLLFYAYSILIIIYVFMSWLPQVQQSALGVAIGKIVEPYLSVFRRFIPPIGMIDLSPIVALFALQFVQRGLIFLITLVLNPGTVTSLFDSLF